MSPTTDDLRELLAHRADDVPLAVALGASGPRLSGVRARVRQARRRRAALSVAAVAATVAGVVAAVTVLPDVTRESLPAAPRVVTTATSLDADGAPPLADPDGRPLQAATTVDAAGPREASLRFTPTEDPDGGARFLLQCTGAPDAHVAWFVGERRLGDVRCGTGRGATFASLARRDWARLGARPGQPAVVTLRVVDAAHGRGLQRPATGPVPAASALLAVYESDAPDVRGPVLRSGGVEGRREGVAGLDRDVRLDAVRDVEGATSALLAATDVPVGPGSALRAFRLRPGTLDGLVAALSCRGSRNLLGDRTVHVSVAGAADTDLSCTNDDGTAPATWPNGDAGPTWRGYGVPDDAPVTVVVRLPALDGPSPAGRVAQRYPDSLDVGFYGVPPTPAADPAAAAAALAALFDPAGKDVRQPLVGTADLTGDGTMATLGIPARTRAVDIRYQCTPDAEGLTVRVTWWLGNDGNGTVLQCLGTVPATVRLEAGTADPADGRFELALDSGTTVVAGLPRSAVVRVTVYAVP